MKHEDEATGVRKSRINEGQLGVCLKETMPNFLDLRTRQARDYVLGIQNAMDGWITVSALAPPVPVWRQVVVVHP